jgi:hypothetical protein
VLYSVILWLIALLCLALPVWLLLNAWNKSKKLDARLIDCDETLLSDSSVKVSQIIAAPPGTTITENVRLMVVPNNDSTYDQSMPLE